MTNKKQQLLKALGFFGGKATREQLIEYFGWSSETLHEIARDTVTWTDLTGLPDIPNGTMSYFTFEFAQRQEDDACMQLRVILEDFPPVHSFA